MKTLAPELRALIIILASAGPGDLDPPILEVVGRRGDRPLALADVPGPREEVERLAGIERRLALLASVEQVQADRPEPALQVGDEVEGVVGQDALRRRERAAR